MTGFKILRQAIIDKVNEAITAGTITHIGEAYWTPADIKKMPAVIVMPEALESEYQDTAGGRHRTFIFRLYILQKIEEGGQTDVDMLLSEGIDELIELFDAKNALTAEDLIGLKPVPSIWDMVEYGGGEARTATMTIRCSVIISTT